MRLRPAGGVAQPAALLLDVPAWIEEHLVHQLCVSPVSDVPEHDAKNERKGQHQQEGQGVPEEQEEREEYRTYMDQGDKSGQLATLGDLFKNLKLPKG